MNRILVIGYGSIGRRHVSNFLACNSKVAVLSRREIEESDFQLYSNLEVALREFAPDAILICNETAEHLATLRLLQSLDFSGRVFVEKPVGVFFDHFDHLEESFRKRVRVLYHLRFHPLILEARAWIEGKRCLSASIYVGQYLPTWRPHSDYRQNYSSSKKRGGGVLLDLSHEVDYLSYLFGKPRGVFARGGKVSSLDGDADDLFQIVFECSNCFSISLELNYLDRNVRRTVNVNADEGTLFLDLIEGSTIEDKIRVNHKLQGNDVYLAMTREILQNGGLSLPTLEEGIETLRILEAVNRSHNNQRWLTL